MTTDTKAVARWDIGINGLSDKAEILWHYQGRYILFTDHERMVGELQAALAASRAEVEGLKKDAERYRWLRDVAGPHGRPVSEKWEAAYLALGSEIFPEEIDTAIDAAMEKGNV